MRCTPRLVLLLSVLLAACGGNAAPGTSRSNLSVVTSAEMQAGLYDNLYDAILALRPHWIRERPSSHFSGGPDEVAQLFVDGTPRGTVRNLGTLRVSEVASVRYLSMTEAASTLGFLAEASPVILVTTKRGP